MRAIPAQSPLMPQATHNLRVDILAVAKCVLSQSSFKFKSKTLVEVYRSFVISIDFEFEPREIQPVVREIDCRTEERSSNTFALPIRMNTDPESAGMSATRLVWKRDDRDHA